MEYVMYLKSMKTEAASSKTKKKSINETLMFFKIAPFTFNSFIPVDSLVWNSFFSCGLDLQRRIYLIL